ncbi:MAG: DUF420 domain-containing protein [Sulfurimonas sp.]|nr:DUF420 domain-containing protein [Sulfurimonas sp.]
MSYMFEAGFLGTRAPFFMDFVTLIVSLLPLLVASSIYLARKKKHKYHIYSQIFIFAFSFIVLVYFEMGVRVGGGFDFFMTDSHVHYTYALIVLVFHIIVSILTLIIWATTIFKAKKQLKQYNHKKAGLITFMGVVMTSLTGVWVYFLMFVY